MPSSETRPATSLPWIPLLLAAAALLLRWVKLESPGMQFLPNFAPWMALAFTGTLVFPRTLPWWSWPLLLLGVDSLAMGAGLWTLQHGAAEVFLPYALYAVAACVAGRLRQRTAVLPALLGVAGASLLFYLITNSVSWFTMAEYAKTPAGWLQALTTGLPGYPPTWMFLRNSLLSDLGFSALLLLAFNAEAGARSLTTLPWRTPREAIA